MKTKVSVYIAIAANGLISNARNVPDWLSQEYVQGLMAICQKTKAVIMGKTTYNILAPDHLPLQDDGIIVVLTAERHLVSDNPTVVFTNENVHAIISMLEEKRYAEAVIIGGALTISAFMDKGLVDDVILVVEPVFFGTGLPLFKNTAFESRLRLVEVTQQNDNTVQLHYSVRK